MRKRLHHHVDVVCLSNHIHTHHAREIVIARGNAVDAIVLVQVLDIFGCVLGIQSHLDVVEGRIEDFIIVGETVEPTVYTSTEDYLFVSTLRNT